MMIFVYSAFIYVISTYIVSLYMAVNERSVTVGRLSIMALPVINTIFVIVILLFDIKPFIKTVINEFKEITK